MSVDLKGERERVKFSTGKLKSGIDEEGKPLRLWEHSQGQGDYTMKDTV
jgi:hypothetical protein